MVRVQIDKVKQHFPVRTGEFVEVFQACGEYIDYSVGNFANDLKRIRQVDASYKANVNVQIALPVGSTKNCVPNS